MVSNRQALKMKDSVFIDPCQAPTIAGRLAYLFSNNSYGNYPDVQAAWDKYLKGGEAEGASGGARKYPEVNFMRRPNISP